MNIFQTFGRFFLIRVEKKRAPYGARYRKSWFKVWLPISMQFHHAQMDGGHAAQYLEDLQQIINHL